MINLYAGTRLPESVVFSTAVAIAKFLTLARTTAMPLSSKQCFNIVSKGGHCFVNKPDAFSSKTRSFISSEPYSSLATASMVDVFPVPVYHAKQRQSKV